MKIVYVITSAGRDAYTAMTRVSAASLRRIHPGAQVAVVCDRETDRAVRMAQDPLLGEAGEWLAFETPPGDAAFRNRFLKTSLRERISGEYLFLDSDTIVRDDLKPLFQMVGDLAAAPNHSREDLSAQIWEGDRAILRQMGWTIGGEFYVNGGVMWVSESEGAKRFYRLWHAKWQTSKTCLQAQDGEAAARGSPAAPRPRTGVDLIGASRDQPALNAALFESGARCVRMACRYNAQIISNPLSVRDAAVWHYYYSLQYQAHSRIDGLIRETIRTQRVDGGRLRDLIEAQSLWRRPFWSAGSGVHLVNGAARDLAAAIEARADADGLVERMRRTDPEFARRTLAKTMVDSYWNGAFEAHRFARARLLRLYPFEALRRPARGCLLHAMMQGGKARLAR